MAIPPIAIPGQDLGPTSKYLPGAGTHIHKSNVYASVAGVVHIAAPAKAAGPQKRLTKITAPVENGLATVSILRSSHARAGDTPPSELAGAGKGKESQMQARPQGRGKAEMLPEVNSTVLCKVTRITPRQATVAILVVGEVVLEGEWQGIIRVQDVRATEKDRVKIFESFRPGDVVRAIVISLGDQSSYYLSTASNNLGVIMATSEAGLPMYPVSWKEFRDPETGLSEGRKVAKPF